MAENRYKSWKDVAKQQGIQLKEDEILDYKLPATAYKNKYSEKKETQTFGQKSTNVPSVKSYDQKKRTWQQIAREQGLNVPDPVDEVKEVNQWKENPIKSAGQNFIAGLKDPYYGAAGILDMITGGKNEAINNDIQRTYDKKRQQEMRLQDINDDSSIGEIAGAVFRAGGQSLPASVVALLGANSIGKNTLLDKTGTRLATGAGVAGVTIPILAKQALLNGIKNPNTIASGANIIGNQFIQAREDGATRGEATKAALISGIPSTLIETSGGLENMDLAQRQSIFKMLLDTAKEEGLEEVAQYPVENMGQKITYDKDMPLFSTKETAVINPGEMAKAGLIGGLAGGLMGGGSAAINSTINKKQTKAINQEYEKVVNTLPEDSPIMERVNEFKNNNVKVTDEAKIWVINQARKQQNNFTSETDRLMRNTEPTAEAQQEDNKPIEQTFKSNETFAKTQNSASATIQRILTNFGIVNINNAREVKQNIYNFYKNSVISDSTTSKPIMNKNSGLQIEVSRATVNQTFQVDEKYAEAEDNEIKVAAMSNIVDLIQNGTVEVVDKSETPSSKTTYANLTGTITIDNVPYSITLDVRRTDNGSKYFVHSLHTEVQETLSKPSGIIYNGVQNIVKQNDPVTYDILDRIGQATGIKIRFVQSIDSPDGTRTDIANGQYDPSTKTLDLSMKSENPLLVVAKHEITHMLQQQSPKLYREYKEFVISTMQEASKEGYEARFNSIKSLHERAGLEISKREIEDEIVADATELFLTNQDAINALAKENPTLGQKILDIIREFIKKVDDAIQGTTSKLMSIEQLRTAEQLWVNALNDVIENKQGNVAEGEAAVTEEFSDSNVKFSLREKDPPKKTMIGYKVFVAKDGKLYPPMAMHNTPTPTGVWLDAEIAPTAKNEDGTDKLTKTGRKQMAAKGGTLAFRPGWHLGEFPIAPQFYEMDKVTGEKKQHPNFVWAECEFAADIDYQKEAMSNGMTPKGKFQHSLAGLQKLPTDGYYKYRTNPDPTTIPWFITGAMKVNKILTDKEVDSILIKNGIEPMKRAGGELDLKKYGFDTKYSLKDSKGRELSKEQQEYFKNSKIRDNKGNLKVVYHGGNAENKFDTSKGATATQFGSGSYFTDAYGTAEEWAKEREGKVGEYYLNISKYFNTSRQAEIEKTPERDNLEKLLKDKGFTSREITQVFTGDYLAPAYYKETPFDTLRRLLSQKDSNIKRNFWKGANEANQLLRQAGYDGIVGDLYDGKQYVAFKPNQIKNVDNKKPTENEGIRYSLKDTQGRKLSQEQQEYFKYSKIRDNQGNLLVVYHSTSGNFNTFDISKSRSYTGNPDYDLPGFYFIADKGQSSDYGERVINAYLNIKKPYTQSLSQYKRDKNLKTWRSVYDELLKEGYDGAIDYDTGTNDIENAEIIAFKPEQIKSIDNKNPTEDQDIRYQLKDTRDSKEVERLKKINENLKEQFTLTKGVKLDKNAIKKLSRSLIKDYNSKYDRAQLETRMIELYAKIANNQIEYEDMEAETKAMARDIIENASVLNDTMHKQYSELRNTLRNTPIALAERYQKDFDVVGGFKAFKKRNLSRIKLSDEGMEVDQLYQELIELYPELFNADITNPADQLMLIEDVLSGLVPIYENPFNQDINEAVEYLAVEIFEDFTSIPEARATFADRKKAELDKTKADNKEKIKVIKEKNKADIDWIKYKNKEKISQVIDNEKAKRDKEVDKLKKRYAGEEYKTWWKNKLKENDIKSHYQEMLAELRTEKNEKIEQTAARYKERISGIYESRKMREVKASIGRKVKRLDAMLRKPTEKKHINKILEKSIAELLQQINFETDNQKEATILKLRDLRAEYEKIAKVSDEEGIQATADPYIMEALEMLNNKRLTDMNLEELEILNNIVGYFEHMVQGYNKAFLNGKWQDISDKAQGILMDLRTDTPHTESAYGAVNSFKDMMKWGMLTPQMYFERMGDTFYSMYNDFRDALDVKISNTKVAQDYMQELLKNSKGSIKEWTGSKTKATEFSVVGGTIELTPSQVMSLYMLLKREQARGHIFGLGIKAAPIEYKKDGKGVKRIKKQFEPVKIAPEDAVKIISTLSKEQRRIAEGIGKFLNTQSKQWVNEATLKNYGYELAKEENYFPIKTDRDFLKSDFDNTNLDPTFTSMGFLKSTVKGAGNAIIIEDIFDVYTEHADKSATYNAFLTVTESTKKIINFKTKQESIKQSMSRKYGNEAFLYLKKFMVDLQGGVRVEGGPPIVNQLIRNTKRTVLGLNMRTIVQQPTAIIRASALIDIDYLMKGIAMKSDKEEMLAHSPIALWKSWGYFNLDTGRTMKDIILDSTPILDKQYIPIQKADDITWTKIWNAVKLEISDTNPALKEGSKEYYEAVNDKFSDIIDRTQVVDTVMHRSDIMRQKDSGWKVLTAFMAEPTKSYNLLMNSKEKYENDKTEDNKKAMLRTTAAWIATTAVNTFIISLVDMWRRDDNDKESLLNKWLDNILNEITGMVPMVRDIYSLLQGYSIKRMEYNGIEKVTRAAARTGNYVLEAVNGEKHKYPLRLLTKDWIESVAYVFGVSAANITREIEAILKNYIRFTENDKGLANDVYEFMFRK